MIERKEDESVVIFMEGVMVINPPIRAEVALLRLLIYLT